MSRLAFESPVTLPLLAGIALAAVLLWALFRRALGPPAGISRRTGFFVLRGLLVATLVLILLNPVRVTQTPGIAERPELFYLVDSSQSMTLGEPTTRWEDALEAMRDAAAQASGSPVDVKLFRFGQRLLASGGLDQIGAGQIGAGAGPGTQQAERASGALSLTAPAYAADVTRNVGPAAPAAKTIAPLAPTDSDTQLITALRQISSRFGHKPPAGIVVFSDGRTRDEEGGVDQIVSQFGRLQVPVHVMPTGGLGKRGDISIVAAVVPPRVRKFSEVEVQVFIRSFGFDGYRTEVELTVPAGGGKPARKLASVPVTLRSGFQAATVSFRSTIESHKVQVGIPTADEEISDANNSLTSEIAIDRTKIRILYLEGSSQPLSATVVGTRQVIRGAHSDVAKALTGDDDIECVVVASAGGGGDLVRIGETGFDRSRGFPETKAELAAFDAIFLSDIPERLLTQQQVDWIEEWIGQRGGGLLMAGGPRSFSSGGWHETKIAEMLPVEMLPGPDWNSSEQIAWKPLPGTEAHPIWSLYTEERRTREALAAIPPLLGANQFAAVKPNLTLTLADGTVTGLSSTPPAGAVPQGDAASVQDFFRRLVETGPESTERQANPAGGAAARGVTAALVVGRYGRGRTIALRNAITPPWAAEFNTNWKQEGGVGGGDQGNYARFWRNLVYWLTENSSIGRRRLIAGADKRFYHPGDAVEITSSAFNELARQTKDYRIVAMIEPNSSLKEIPGDYSPLKWPEGIPRTSGEEGPYIAWGEELEIPLVAEGDKPAYGLKLAIADTLLSGAASQSLRLELTAYEDQTQVDSTSLDVQILHDPFELQNPFPNHDLLKRIATLSGGKVLSGADDLAKVLGEIPIKVGAPVVSRSPIWSSWWLWCWLVGLLTAEWLWRRRVGLA